MWLLDVLSIKEVITCLFLVTLVKKSFALPFCFGYIRVIRNELKAVTVFTGSPPDSIVCVWLDKLAGPNNVFQILTVYQICNW